MEEETYRERKEYFVSNLTGGSIWEINSVTFVAPAAVLLWSILQSRQRFFEPYTVQACIVDILLQCGAILFATTVYADNPEVLIGFLVLPAIALYLNQPSTEVKRAAKPPPTVDEDDKSVKDADSEEVDYLPVKPFVTHYRGEMMIITCICILAVDFPVFPRRFAKTETLGTSIMDLGVGSFVFAAGLSSVRQQLKEEDFALPKSARSTWLGRVAQSIRNALPLAALGLVRLYSVKSLDYTEHVSEYGVHWNFFFTLSVIPPVLAFFQPLFSLSPSYAPIGYAISLAQQVLFIYTDLGKWTLGAPREDFISANKEGLVSLAGYFAIYMAGQTIGINILGRDQDPLAPQSETDTWLASVLGGEEKVAELQKQRRHYAIISLLKWSVIWCVVYYFTTGTYGPRIFISRRLGNMGYFVWVSAFNCVSLTLFCLVEMLLFPDVYLAKDKATERSRISKATSKVLNAYNRNGFALFLLANLLTGFVNMTMPTIDMGDVEAMVVLVTYVGTLTAVGLGLDHYNMSLKL